MSRSMYGIISGSITNLSLGYWCMLTHTLPLFCFGEVFNLDGVIGGLSNVPPQAAFVAVRFCIASGSSMGVDM